MAVVKVKTVCMESQLSTKQAGFQNIVSLNRNFRSSEYISSAKLSRIFSVVSYKKSD